MTQAQAVDRSTPVKPEIEVCSQFMVITFFSIPLLQSPRGYRSDAVLELFF